jgi:hypothetical protein
VDKSFIPDCNASCVAYIVEDSADSCDFALLVSSPITSNKSSLSALSLFYLSFVSDARRLYRFYVLLYAVVAVDIDAFN